MEINVISDTHSNFFKEPYLSKKWVPTLEDIVRANDNIMINLGDTIGEYNRIIVDNSKYYICVPGNHDVELLRGKIVIGHGNVLPFQYWEAFYDKKTWNKLREWGYGSNIRNVKKYFCYFLYPIDDLLLIPSHIPLKYEKQILDDIISLAEGKVKYVYNIYGHSHNSKFSISRRKYKDMTFISIHVPPFFIYASSWKLEFNEKKVSIKEVYYRKGELRIEKVKKPKVGEWIG